MGAFASINAQQGYRPVPVAQFAMQLMSASAAGKPAPAAPEIEDPAKVKNAADYVGVYTSPSGKSIEISGDGGLFATVEGKRIPLQHGSGDYFMSADPLLTDASFLFGRANSEKAKDDKNKDKPGPVVELMHGSDWYPLQIFRPRARSPSHPIIFRAHRTYLGAGAFEGSSFSIVILKGQLWAEGQFPLERIVSMTFVPPKTRPILSGLSSSSSRTAKRA